jgi:hypothetical protein
MAGKADEKYTHIPPMEPSFKEQAAKWLIIGDCTTLPGCVGLRDRMTNSVSGRTWKWMTSSYVV